MAKDRFRVIIVGGGVAGLTLANALEQAGVDYLLLEARDTVAPDLGATIGIHPNGARILDQLGIWAKIEVAERMTPRKLGMVYYHRDNKGNLICPADNIPKLLTARTGYFLRFLERWELLAIIRDNLKDQSKILVNKKVTDIKDGDDIATVICEDGSLFHGDLVVGADGVFSKTRAKIWELAEPENPGLVKSERNRLQANYVCVFGISRDYPFKEPAVGNAEVFYDRNRCLFVFIGEGRSVYWLLQERLPKTHRLGDIPRYTDKEVCKVEARKLVTRNLDIVIRSSPERITMKDIWETTVKYNVTATEEATFRLWHWGRLVCVGDSVHKTTPNMAAGGNMAIESVAALANGIKQLADSFAATKRRPTRAEIEQVMSEYQKRRYARAKRGVEDSGVYTQANNMDSLPGLVFRYSLPLMMDVLPELAANTMIAAEKLDFLPLPSTSLTGTMPYNQSQGSEKREGILKRMAFGFPMLLLLVLAVYVMDLNPAVPLIEEVLAKGSVEVDGITVPIQRTFFGQQGVDDWTSAINTFFFPCIYDLVEGAWHQILSFLTDGVVLLTVLIYEANRRANHLTLLQWPMLFAFAAQFVGIGLIGPIYTFIHYVLSPLDKYAASDQRLTNVRATKAALPAVALGLLVPVYLSNGIPPIPLSLNPEPLSPDQRLRQFQWQQTMLGIFFQPYPILVSVFLFFISRIWNDTTEEDKYKNTGRDLPVIEWSVGLASIFSAALWIWSTSLSPTRMQQVFIPKGLLKDIDSMWIFAAEFLKWDEVFGLGSYLLWLAYLFWDLKVAGMLKEGWLKVVGLGLLCLYCFGPGATIGAGWLFREHILATRRHKDALTLESVGRLHKMGYRQD